MLSAICYIIIEHNLSCYSYSTLCMIINLRGVQGRTRSYVHWNYTEAKSPKKTEQ